MSNIPPKDDKSILILLVPFALFLAFAVWMTIYTFALEPRFKCSQYAQMYPDREIRYYSQFGCVEKRDNDIVILEFGHSNGQDGGQ